MKQAAVLILCFFSLGLWAQRTDWPVITSEMKPAARWWWMGSAVDKNNLDYNISEYAKKGLGGLEITPIYGVKNNEANEIPFLSAKWMNMLNYSESVAEQHNITIDMNTGTGWPFGGPQVTIEDAATKVIFQEYELKGGQSLPDTIQVKDKAQLAVANLSRLMAYSTDGKKIDLSSKVENGQLRWTAPKGEWRLIAVFAGKTFQKVKRAAPGGEGYVMNHFSQKAVAYYLASFTESFSGTDTNYPNSFFNDSYEVYGADWTPDMFDQFEKRRGYKLEDYLPAFISKERNDTTARVISDYRETLSELLLENFTQQWTSWAHKHGSTTRNQAHGSPANLLDIYAAVDIPECESFGISDFHINGLRKDSLTKKNDSDLSMLKYASSAAHITGKPYVSSETFTWLTEHFRTSLSQCKPDLDLLFLSGVNHVFFHGITYSPKEAKWPGWKFYASVDMSPTNSIWRDSQPFFEYIARCQSFLQEGKPDNDFLLYFPVYDMWYEQDGRLLMFDIHKMQRRAPQFISAVDDIVNAGYDVDYISDKYLMSTSVKGNKLETIGGNNYKAIIVPGARVMPLETLAHLLKLANDGATVIFLDRLPEKVQGLYNLNQRQIAFSDYIKSIHATGIINDVNAISYGEGKIITGTDYEKALRESGVKQEEMKTLHGLQYIRRSNSDGYHYFISSLQNKDIDKWITLSVDAKSTMMFNPLDGSAGLAQTKKEGDKLQVHIQLKSGQSIILKTFNKELSLADTYAYYESQEGAISINKGWKVRFIESEPTISGTFALKQLGSWTDLPAVDAKRNMGTAIYSTEFNLPSTNDDDWLLNLGDVRESARVRINGKDVATLWSVPYEVKVGNYLQKGKNRIEVEVTNLPANRIADYDRQKIDWRIFKEINFVKIDYKNGDYSHWEAVPSGLLGPVVLSPVRKIQ
ncbi:MAG: glycosyl hydrolase [Dysgonomonas sp.]